MGGGGVVCFRRLALTSGINLQKAEEYQKSGNTVAAASSYMRASVYLQLSERFSDHLSEAAKQTWILSVDSFIQAMNLKSPLIPSCQ